MKHHVSNVNHFVAHHQASVSAQASSGGLFVISVETLALMAGLLLQQREVVVLFGFIWCVYCYSPMVQGLVVYSRFSYFTFHLAAKGD